jgi:hypothetical protein
MNHLQVPEYVEKFRVGQIPELPQLFVYKSAGYFPIHLETLPFSERQVLRNGLLAN